MLVCYCKERLRRKGSNRNPSLRTIEKEAYAWAEQGINTLEEAAAYMQAQNARYTRTANLMKLLQISGRSLTPAEDRYAQAWLDMDFDSQALQMAYEKTCLNTGGLKWPYMNKILQSWHQQNLHTGAQIQAGDKNPLPRPSGSRRVPPPWVRWSGRPLPGCSGSRNRRGNQWHIQERCCAGPGSAWLRPRRSGRRRMPSICAVPTGRCPGWRRLTGPSASPWPRPPRPSSSRGGDPQAEFARIRQENQAPAAGAGVAR